MVKHFTMKHFTVKCFTPGHFRIDELFFGPQADDGDSTAGRRAGEGGKFFPKETRPFLRP
jgi:hypothetical protein